MFLFLTFLFVSAGVFIQNDERAARISKAQSVAEQVKISLEVFSSERKAQSVAEQVKISLEVFSSERFQALLNNSFLHYAIWGVALP